MPFLAFKWSLHIYLSRIWIQIYIDKDPYTKPATLSESVNTASHIRLLHIKQNPFSCLPIDCSHKAARKRKCQGKRRAGESLITAESGWAASMRGQQLWSLGEVSVRRSQSVQAAPNNTPTDQGQWFTAGEMVENMWTTTLSPQDAHAYSCAAVGAYKDAEDLNWCKLNWSVVEGKWWTCFQPEELKGTIQIYIYYLLSSKMAFLIKHCQAGSLGCHHFFKK